jgi:hypothetical protein
LVHRRDKKVVPVSLCADFSLRRFQIIYVDLGVEPEQRS